MGFRNSCVTFGAEGDNTILDKGLAEEHMCISHRHRQQCGNSQKEKSRSWCRWAREGNGDICNSVNGKNKEQYYVLSRGWRHYLCLPELFTLTTSLEIQSGTEGQCLFLYCVPKCNKSSENSSKIYNSFLHCHVFWP